MDSIVDHLKLVTKNDCWNAIKSGEKRIKVLNARSARIRRHEADNGNTPKRWRKNNNEQAIINEETVDDAAAIVLKTIDTNIADAMRKTA